MSFVLLWLGHEGQGRWRTLLALGLLVAVTTAVVLTAVADPARLPVAPLLRQE